MTYFSEPSPDPLHDVWVPARASTDAEAQFCDVIAKSKCGPPCSGRDYFLIAPVSANIDEDQKMNATRFILESLSLASMNRVTTKGSFEAAYKKGENKN